MFSGISYRPTNWGFRRIGLLILLAIHLPFLFAYFRGLWQQTHYQFFPFAVGAFVWLFVTRRSSEPERWMWPAWILISFDLACLAVQPWLYSPWLAAAGLLACVTALCFVNRDTGYDRRLTYLALLPLLVVRLPMQYDVQMINWLQRGTTAVASRLLQQLDMLHFRDGNVLRFPGKNFLVEEACSGVQSLFTILFIAALVVCLKRRSWIHGIVLLAAAVALAGLMNVMRVTAIAVAWESFGTDLSTGAAHDILGYLCLGGAALLLMSADALYGVITDPVPDFAADSGLEQTWNPLILLWNRFVAVIPLSATATISQGESLIAVAGPASAPSIAQRQQHPSPFELFRPSNLLRSLPGWFESWFVSRRYSQLLVGLPFVMSLIAGAVLAWWPRHSSADSLIARYEAAYDIAVRNDDSERQELYLRALSRIRVNEPEYQFRIAQLMLKQGRIQEGLNEIYRLAPETGAGFAPARMWLVKQSMQPTPLKPLSFEEVEKHLLAVLNQNSRHLEARQILARVSIDRKAWKQAEVNLTFVADQRPEENLALAKVKKLLNRSAEDIQATADKAVTALTSQLESDVKDPATRVNLAEALMLADKESEAREVLITGLEQQEVPLVRRALTSLDLFRVSRSLSENQLSSDLAVRVVTAALQKDPSNALGIELLERLQTLGVQASPESVQASLEYWQQATEQKPDDETSRMLLTRLLVATGSIDKAAESIQPLVAERPELRRLYANLLRQSGESEESAELLEEVIAESREKLTADPQNAGAAAALADALRISGRTDEARAILSKFSSNPGTSRIPSVPMLANLYGQCCIETYDRLMGYREDPRLISTSVEESAAARVDTDILLELLADAFACPATTNQAVARIARLSLSSHPAASSAEAMVQDLRMEGSQSAQVLNLLGMHALAMSRYEKARTYLQQANAQTRGRDPMILNNLAVAMIRGESSSGERALELVNAALDILPGHPDLLSTRGEVYVSMSRWDDAIADLVESLELRRNSVVVHRLLEKSYTGLADSVMATKHRQRADELESAQVAW